MSERNQVSLIIAFGRQAARDPISSGRLERTGAAVQQQAKRMRRQTTVDIVKDTYTISPHIVNQAAVAYGRYKSLSVTPD